MTFLYTLWQATGLNRFTPYILTILVTTGIIVAVYMQGRREGKSSALSKQQTDWLKQYHREVTNRADIQRMRTADARDRLRERWSSD